MRLAGNGADTGPAAAVGDGECLVGVGVTDIPSDSAQGCKSDERVAVGAVDVDLATVVVNNLACFLDAFFEHAECRRVGDHECGKICAMLGGLFSQILEIERAIRKCLDGDDFVADHGSGSRIGAVSRKGGSGKHRDDLDSGIRGKLE